jgi:Xaa-Pro aminopeptidase
VRIEDDVLIHQDKAEVLSINIPKEIADIEKLFRTKGL